MNPAIESQMYSNYQSNSGYNTQQHPTLPVEPRYCDGVNSSIKCSENCVNYADLNGDEECKKIQGEQGKYWGFKEKTHEGCDPITGRAVCELKDTLWLWILGFFGGSVIVFIIFIIILLVILYWLYGRYYGTRSVSI
jgi:hypothetical protein